MKFFVFGSGKKTFKDFFNFDGFFCLGDYQFFLTIFYKDFQRRKRFKIIMKYGIDGAHLQTKVIMIKKKFFAKISIK